MCVIFFLSPWMDQPSLRYQMVYAIFMEIIIPIPYSIFHTMLYVIYDLEGSYNVDPLVSGFGQIYLTVKYI